MSGYKIPVAIFVFLVIVLAIALNHDPRMVPSPFIGKPAPAFNLPVLNQPDQYHTQQDYKGQVWVLNVFASWCGTCAQEHPQIRQLARSVLLVGLNKEDETFNANRWLSQHGNPYQEILVDRHGRTSIDWGVYAVPETFIMDKQGIVRYKHIGAIDKSDLNKTILPLIKQLKAEQG